MDVQKKFHSQGKTNIWVIENGCSSDMTGGKRKFINLVKQNGRLVKFGDNSSAKIYGKGTISIDGKSRKKYVIYVEGVERMKKDPLNVFSLMSALVVDIYIDLVNKAGLVMEIP